MERSEVACCWLSKHIYIYLYFLRNNKLERFKVWGVNRGPPMSATLKQHVQAHTVWSVGPGRVRKRKPLCTPATPTTTHITCQLYATRALVPAMISFASYGITAKSNYVRREFEDIKAFQHHDKREHDSWAAFTVYTTTTCKYRLIRSWKRNRDSAWNWNSDEMSPL